MNASARSISFARVWYCTPAAEFFTKSAFQLCTLRRWAKPPVTNARVRFRVAAEALYTPSSRSGSGVRASVVKSKPFTASPRYAGSETPSRVSVAELRGLAYCPAIRPILTIGTWAA